MAGRIRFVCVIHSHQPVGNFDHVIEEAYQNSYKPYVDVFREFPSIPLTNHFSGCLLEWLEEHHPEYLSSFRAWVAPRDASPDDDPHARKSWEMIGGGFYEPIMTMLPEHDCQAQTWMLADYLEKHTGVRPRGFWLTERVWEPSLVRKLADAGVSYLTLDDSHFRAAGLSDDELVGGYITEDEGRILTVYPASERLRYLIPFARVHEVIGYLKSLIPEDGERIVCYADDGEKFGVWPNTFKTVYEEGWLRNFLTALRHAQEEGWLICSTLGDAFNAVLPAGRAYLPENSYREMTEWALPATRLALLEKAREEVKNDPRVQDILPLVRGGNWRSFRVKYPEIGRMYGKMMEVSKRVLESKGKSRKLEEAKVHLYRGQCNCPYWHGVFGGVYLPHLRSAIYRELIRAEKKLDEATQTTHGIVRQDFDFDGEDEVKLFNKDLALYLHPSRGGHLYELDLKEAEFNVSDTFSRRFEAYHAKVSQAVVGEDHSGGSIHAMVLAKEEGLQKLLHYDAYLRESLVDHLCDRPFTVDDFTHGRPPSDEGFRQGFYEVAEANPEATPSSGITLFREAAYAQTDVRVTKSILLEDGSRYTASYEVANVGSNPLAAHFGVEMNYSLLAGDAHDRYYYFANTDNAGPLGMMRNLGQQPFVGLKDHWLNVALTLHSSPPAHVVVSPVRTVSQSEGGFESIYQSSAVVLQWPLLLEPGQSFRVRLDQEVGRAH